jgi:hypothetical protein
VLQTEKRHDVKTKMLYRQDVSIPDTMKVSLKKHGHNNFIYTGNCSICCTYCHISFYLRTVGSVHGLYFHLVLSFLLLDPIIWHCCAVWCMTCYSYAVRDVCVFCKSWELAQVFHLSDRQHLFWCIVTGLQKYDDLNWDLVLALNRG